MTKACKVIVLYIGERRDSKTNNPQTPEQCWELFTKHLLPKELKVDKGIACDTLIINHTEDETYNNRLIEFDNLNTPNGKLWILNCDNIGGSFGGYNQAYQNFKHQYKYWCFIEDDIIINEPEYYIKAVNMLDSDPNLAFVAITPIAIPCLHAAGGCGITTINWLNIQALENNGQLISPMTKTDFRDMMPNQLSEEQFTYFFTKMGKGIKNIDGFSPYPINIEQHDPFFRLRPQLNNDVGDKIYYIGLPTQV